MAAFEALRRSEVSCRAAAREWEGDGGVVLGFDDERVFGLGVGLGLDGGNLKDGEGEREVGAVVLGGEEIGDDCWGDGARALRDVSASGLLKEVIFSSKPFHLFFTGVEMFNEEVASSVEELLSPVCRRVRLARDVRL